MLSESELYEDISYGLQLFRKVLQAAQHGDPQPLLQQCKMLVEKYKDQRIETKIMKRFACRLLETIIIYKSRPYLYAQALPMLEASIQKQHFASIFITLQKLFSKQEEPVMTSVEEHSSNLIVGKIIQKVQVQFDNMKGLDLDYGSFKSGFFQAKNIDSSAMIQSCIMRNTHAKNSIQKYQRIYWKRKRLSDQIKIKREEKHKSVKKMEKEMEEVQNKKQYEKQQEKYPYLEEKYIRNKFYIKTIEERQKERKHLKPLKNMSKQSSYDNINQPVALKLAALYCKNDKKRRGLQSSITESKKSFRMANILMILSPEENQHQSLQSHQLPSFHLYKKELNQKIKNLTQCYNLNTKKRIDSLKAELAQKAKQALIQRTELHLGQKTDPNEGLNQNNQKGFFHKYNVKKLRKLYSSTRNVIN